MKSNSELAKARDERQDALSELVKVAADLVSIGMLDAMAAASVKRALKMGRSRHSMPEKLASDHGMEFVRAELRKLLQAIEA